VIRITIELVSANTGVTSRLASATITNDGTDTSGKGNYDAFFYLKQRGIWRTARVEKFPRKYKNVWHLVRQALNDALNAET
jgi:hypothetical protein